MRPADCDPALAERIGRLALRDVGYGEILRLAYEARLIRFVERPRRAASGTIDGKLIGQVQTPSPRARELEPAPSLKRVPPAPAKRADESMEADEMEEVAVFTEEAVQGGVVKGTVEEAAAGLLLLPTALELELALAGAGATAAETGGAFVAAEAAAGVAVSSAALAVAGIVVIGIIAIAVADELVLDHAISNALRDALRATGPSLGPVPIGTVGQMDQPQTQPQPGPGPGPISSTGPTPPLPPRCTITKENHRGGNDFANDCAEKVPGNAFPRIGAVPGSGVEVEGVHYDVFRRPRTLMEVKAHHFSSYSDFVKEMEMKMVPKLEAERDVAVRCGFEFVVGVIDDELARILRGKGFTVEMIPC